MKILFLGLHWGYLRHYRSALEQLACRGHSIHLAVDKEDKIGSFRMIESLVAEHPSISSGRTPDRRRDVWFDVGTWLRLGMDYLRYLRPDYEPYPKLRQRSRQRTPWLVLLWTSMPGLGSAMGRRFLGSCLQALERDLPIDEKTRAFIAGHEPDIVLITPLLGLGTAQFDQLRCAKEMGYRVGLCVGSWDHLSSKALIRFTPDLITVWNEVQKGEAVNMHGVDPESVKVTGAQGWDQWFDRQPACSRVEFCRRLRLDPNEPFLLYLCSTPFTGSMPECRFVQRWVQAIRSSQDPRLRRAGILIRPHPQRLSEWADMDLSAFGNLTLWGDNPVTADARNDYFDSMYHCAAAMGLNTSAMIEAGILGKPVHTILAPEYRQSQTETVHFHYLMKVGGGLLHTARGFEEHCEQLAAALSTEGAASERSRRFTEAFVRPFGLDQAATPRFVEAIEQAATEKPRPDQVSRAMRVLQVLLYPLLAGAWVSAKVLGVIFNSPMTVHRGKKRIRSVMLRLWRGMQLIWKLSRDGLRRASRAARWFIFRTGKRFRALARLLSSIIRMGSHRVRKRTLALGRLLGSIFRADPPTSGS